MGYVAGEGGGSIVVSYGCSVDGIRYYGAFNPSIFEEIGFFNFKIRNSDMPFKNSCKNIFNSFI